MATTQEERIENALNQLIECLVPSYPTDDEDQIEERLDEAFNYASDALASAREPAVASDINHASDLIKPKLIRENDTPEKALRYGNLYSRLLAQPVLSQKWAMLAFLFHMSNDSPDARASRVAEVRRGSREPLETASPAGAAAKPFVVDSPAFNAAFSKPGLLRLPEREQSDPVRLSTISKIDSVVRMHANMSSLPAARDLLTADRQKNPYQMETKSLPRTSSSGSMARQNQHCCATYPSPCKAYHQRT